MKVFKCKLDGDASRELEIVDETACHYIYDLHFALSERKPEGEVFVEIEFSMDVGGVLMVKCYDPTNHRRVIYSHEYEAVYGSYSIVCNKQTNNISVSLEHYNEPTLLEVAGAEQEMTPLASLFSNTKQASQILSKSSDTLYPDFAEVSI
jgi:singapore isolate B (sub-type 7) whole genome shotgun sequence assembly, scaffold_1